MNSTRRVTIVLALILIFLPRFGAAHDIPADVRIQTFLKPAGQNLHLLVRVPLKAMLDIDFPKRGPGFLDLARVEPSLHDAATLWISENIDLYEGHTLLARPAVIDARVSIESDRSFQSYEEALAHVTGPRLPDGMELYWNQGLLDVLFEYPIQSDHSEFSIHPKLARLGLRVATVLRFLPPDGTSRAYEYADDPGLIRLDPRWHQAALRFVVSGFYHILDGTDHLLFLLCLVIPVRSFRALVLVVTSFTVAHSLTLIAAAYNLGPGASWFPPLIETLIAISICYMALENIVKKDVERRWIIAFGFGLVHGFGFSFALHETMQFAGSHLLISLLSFNVGVESGQLLVLCLLVPALHVVFKYIVAERIGAIILSALVAHTGWHWTIERLTVLRQYDIQWTAINAGEIAAAMRFLMVVVFLAGLIWLVDKRVRRGAGKLARPFFASNKENERS